MIDKINVDILDALIIGRVEPHIYAFTTETFPNYLKVGDTYRPIEIRLNEWRKYFPNLEKKFQDVAKVDNETFFRDHAVHYYLEKELKLNRLKRDAIASFPYYSNEFFEYATEKDVRDAITDIKNGHRDNLPKYQYYRFSDSHIPINHTYRRTETYLPRPNQQETIQKFQAAVAKGRNNLLMYAVMRFGKSFTSICCAVAMDAKLVVVVSAKADVKEEWKKTVESHVKFQDYIFIDSNSLFQNEFIIAQHREEGKRIVLFLTLQDLQGSEIKSKHTELFDSHIDLLLIDETHFGARAIEYGKVLKADNLTAKEIKSELKLNDDSFDQLTANSKFLKATVRIHLSGTPYRILMNSEFSDEDIIAFYQFTNISEDQHQWDADNLNKDDIKEWDNPYYGFPQMIRFAFNANESSRKKMEEMKRKGVTYAFSELFKPRSIIVDKKSFLHRKFIHEKEIVELLRVIDGSEHDRDLLSFLDYDKIRDGNMCRHIVCVLPYRASCDAMEELIATNEFKHLGAYQIINISGVENERKYPDSVSIQSEIKKLEGENVKTITLTVNRMLTGSTAPEWDTMLYFKDTASPQEYDQAIFRLQNLYVKTYKDPSGDIIRYNLKPQTLLVDFNPNRMFLMQEHKAQIYNANTESNGNSKLEQRITRELEVSPIIVLNHNKIVEIKAADIIDAVRSYSSDRSVIDEATSISIDYSLLEIAQIKAEIEKQGQLGSRQGLEILPSKGEGDDIGVEDVSNRELNNGDDEEEKTKLSEDEPELDYKRQFAMFYARVLFFAFLTDSIVKSLADIIDEIDNNYENLRVAKNIALNKDILILLQAHANPFILSELDYKIQNINSLANDSIIAPIDRASNAMKKFSRLSDSEIVTPEVVADRIVGALSIDDTKSPYIILDIAAKQGEFVYAIYKRFGSDAANRVYSIPTSKIAYEFTRKVYKLLDLDTDHIESSYTAYDLITSTSLSHIKINEKDMQFNVILGNPPYQQKEGGANSNTALPIYNHFVDLAKRLNPDYISLIMPTRWYAGGRGLDAFRDEMLNDIHLSELHDFLRPELIFQNINIRGGICYFLWDRDYDNSEDLTTVFTYKDTLIPVITKRSLRTANSDILIRHGIGVSIIEKVNESPNFESIATYVSAAKAFGFRTYFIKDKKFRSSAKKLKDPIVCYGRGNAIGYVEKNEVEAHQEWIGVWKVFTPESNNIGTELNDDNQNSFIAKPGTVCTETFLVVGADLSLNELSANNLSNYLKTRFARFMHSLAKISQHGTSKTYQFVPLQNFESGSDINWNETTGNIDKQLYKKYRLNDEEIEFIELMIKPKVS